MTCYHKYYKLISNRSPVLLINLYFLSSKGQFNNKLCFEGVNNWIVATTVNYLAIGVKNCTLIGECSIDSRRMSRSNHFVA